MRVFPVLHMRRRGCIDKLARATRLGAVVVGTGVLCPALARADDSFHPLDSMLKALDLKTDVAPAADFVQSSRPKSDTGFVPVGAPHPDRTVKVKTPAELKAAEADLDAARMRHDKLAGRKPPPLTTPASKAPATAKPATQN